MIRAIVNGIGAELHVEVRPSGVPGYVHVVTAGSKRGPYAVSGGSEWAEVAKDFCGQVHGAASGASPWGVALHLCGLVFAFGNVNLGGHSSGEPDYSPLQKRLIDIWRQGRRSSTPESATDAIGKMIELGGPHSL